MTKIEAVIDDISPPLVFDSTINSSLNIALPLLLVYCIL